MKILERYIAGVVLLYTLIVMFVLLGLYFFTTLVGQAAMVGQGSYTMLNALFYSATLIPRQIYELFPMAALLGAMLGLGSLANSSELTVMRAAGISIRNIAMAVAKIGALMVIVVALISEFVAPEIEKKGHFQRMASMEFGISFGAETGLWVRDGESFLSVERLLPSGEARGITRYMVDGQRLSSIVHARHGLYSENGWQVEGVTITSFDDDQVVVKKREKQQWQSTLTPEVIASAALAADRLSIRELAEFISYLRENGLASHRYEVAMWMRVFVPLAAGGMILLALPFVFGSGRNLEMDRRILLGVLIGIGFYLFNGVFSRMGVVYNLSPFISAATPTVLVYLLWFALMRRLH